MPISWKKKFKPDLLLEKIDRARTVSSTGGVSFSSLELYQQMPVLVSMLDFPQIANRLNKGSLIWTALSQLKGPLNKASFESEINRALKKELSTAIQRYVLVTSLSVEQHHVPRSIRIFDATLEFLHDGLPKNFEGHRRVIRLHNIPVPETPSNYLPIRIAVRDKSPSAAALQAIDHVDLFRGLVALYANLAMQFGLSGNSSFDPINRLRCGSRHTIHMPNGKIASEALWYEPAFKPNKLLPIDNKLFNRVRADLRCISRSPYQSELTNALIKYARAFDEPDPNNAFLKLWSALESLTTPHIADYDKLVKRCSFIYAETDYHFQVLEHLREYRNRTVHSGIESSDARINCFLLQSYFRSALHFYKGNFRSFRNLQEANDFLDLTPNPVELGKKIKALRKAIRFIGP